MAIHLSGHCHATSARQNFTFRVTLRWISRLLCKATEHIPILAWVEITKLAAEEWKPCKTEISCNRMTMPLRPTLRTNSHGRAVWCAARRLATRDYWEATFTFTAVCRAHEEVSGQTERMKPLAQIGGIGTESSARLCGGAPWGCGGFSQLWSTQ